MQITLDHLYARNFKGFTDISIDFTHTTFIYGQNASGKTSLLDAFSFLIFGKDSTGRSDFQARPVDADGKTIDGVDIVVGARLDVDGQKIDLEKTQKQVWTKKRGSTAPTFSGNTNTYKIDGFPITQKEFDAQIASIINEKLFRLITNPKTFASMRWQEQREILLRFVAEITDADVLELDKEKYRPVADAVLTVGAEKARELVERTIRDLKKEQDTFPVRIDEAMRAVVSGIDGDAVKKQETELLAALSSVRAERDSLDASLASVSDIQNQILKLRMEMGEIERKANQETLDKRNRQWVKVEEAKGELMQTANEINRRAGRINYLKQVAESTENSIREAMAEWKTEKHRAMPEDKTVCETCGRPFEAEKIEEIVEAFEKRKKRDLDRIEARGKRLRADLDQMLDEIAKLERDVSELKVAYTGQKEICDRLTAEMNAMPTAAEVSTVPEYQRAVKRMNEFQSRLASMDTGEAAKKALSDREALISERLRDVRAELAQLDANKRLLERVEEIREEQRDAAQKVADQEEKQYLLDCFMKQKMDLLSDKINSKFRFVRFRLFGEFINGGIKETCTMQIASNGSFVDYAFANAAAQIQGGLDVINSLSELYGVTAPIWIDNRESVTTIPEMKAQVINLVVSPEDGVLRVENK